MYKNVQTEEELAMFNGVWTTVWRESGFELEFSEDVLQSIMVLNERQQAVGTAEIKQYYTDERSAINRYAPFTSHYLIKQGNLNVAECDKVSLLKGYRGKGDYTHALLSSLCDSSMEHQFMAMVSLLEPSFMKALKRMYGVPMDEVGEPFFYKGAMVVPVVIKVYEVYSNLSHYSWYRGRND